LIKIPLFSVATSFSNKSAIIEVSPLSSVITFLFPFSATAQVSFLVMPSQHSWSFTAAFVGA